MPAKLRIGDWVEVRSKREILETLDGDGCLEGMPFMPEMFEFCEKRFQVYKIAHKTCDYSVYPYQCRRLTGTVHLKTRCSGEAHDGCEAACLLYWKERWLKVADASGDGIAALRRVRGGEQLTKSACTEERIWSSVRRPLSDDGTPTYKCQMTQIHQATSQLDWWDPRQYISDYRSGNVTMGRMVLGFMYWIYFALSEAGIGVGRPMRWLYDRCNLAWRGARFPRTPGRIPQGQPTPFVDLDLQPGELVRVKSHDEILNTVDAANKNRGMYWDAELVPYCGGTFRVLRRVSRLIGERTGKMQEMKSACIALDSVLCQARYSSCRMFCPKGMYPYWREIWLERVDEPAAVSAATEETAVSPMER